MTWTDDEIRQLDGIRYRQAATRALRAVATGLCITLATRNGIPAGVAAWLLAMLACQCMAPEVPENLEARAREIDRQRAARR